MNITQKYQKILSWPAKVFPLIVWLVIRADIRCFELTPPEIQANVVVEEGRDALSLIALQAADWRGAALLTVCTDSIGRVLQEKRFTDMAKATGKTENSLWLLCMRVLKRIKAHLADDGLTEAEQLDLLSEIDRQRSG